MKIKLENLIEATKIYDEINAKCKSLGRVPFDDIKTLDEVKAKYNVTIAQCEIFSDVLKTQHFQEKLRDAMVEVYNCALLDLKTQYLDNHESSKYYLACELEDSLV